MQREDRLELEQGETLSSVADEMKREFQPDLQEELDGTESSEDVARMIRRWVREELAER